MQASLTVLMQVDPRQKNLDCTSFFFKWKPMTSYFFFLTRKRKMKKTWEECSTTKEKQHRKKKGNGRWLFCIYNIFLFFLFCCYIWSIIEPILTRITCFILFSCCFKRLFGSFCWMGSSSFWMGNKRGWNAYSIQSFRSCWN